MIPNAPIRIEDEGSPLAAEVQAIRSTARRLVVVREIAREIGIHHALISGWIYEGKLPRPIIVGRQGRQGAKRLPGRPIAMGYLAEDEVEAVKAKAIALNRERLARMEGFA